MAPKRADPIEIPPAASSDEEEEVTSSGEEEEGSSSEEEDPQTPLIPNNPPPKTPETATPSAANEESESASDSESESDTPKLNTKPIAAKPVAMVKASSSKRPVDSSQSQQEEEAKEVKRPKKKAAEEEGSVVKKPSGGGEDAKKMLFQRLFSEEDEIALLKGMLDYSAKNGADPIADMNGFYDFVKKSIHTDVTRAQVIDKIRRLKKKFENNVGKGKGDEDPNFSKAHEFDAFKLSKKIWGKEGISGKVKTPAAKSNGRAKVINKTIIALKAPEVVSSPDTKVIDGGVKVERGVTAMEVDNNTKVSNGLGSFFDKRFGVGSLEEEVLKHGFDVVDAEKKAGLEAKWRSLKIRQLELFVERNELVKDLAMSMLKSYKDK